MSDALAGLRRRHQRLLFEQLRHAGAASRAGLARFTGLSAPTVGKVIDQMIRDRLVEPMPDAASDPAVGRPAQPLRIDATRARVLCVQLGVRHTRLAALPLAGPRGVSWPIRFATPKRAVLWQRKLADAAAPLLIERDMVVAVSVPGVVDEADGRVLLCPNLPWVRGSAVADAVSAALGRPTVFVQEIRALAMGHAGSPDAPRDFLLVDVGDGVGAAVVSGGQLQRTSLPLSGELGHTPVPGNPLRCGCGGVGCLETLLSRGGLARAMHRGTRQPAGWPGVEQRVRSRGVEPWLADILDAAATIIAGAINVVGVRQIVVTGALAELPSVVNDALADRIRGGSMWSRFGEIACVAAPRRRAAGLVAAAIDRLLVPDSNRPETREQRTWLCAN